MLTKAQFAEREGTSEKTVQRWLNAGLLDEAGAVLIDGQWRIPEDAQRPAKGTTVATVPAPRAAVPARAAEVSVPASLAAARLWWTLDELAELYSPHITRYAVEEMVKAGEIRGYKRGRKGSWVVPTSEVRRLLGA